MLEKIVCQFCGDDSELNFYPDNLCICQDCIVMKDAFDKIQKVFIRIKKRNIIEPPFKVTDDLSNGLSELFETD